MGGYVWIFAWAAIFATGAVIGWEAWRVRQMKRRDKQKAERKTAEIYNKDKADASRRDQTSV